MQTKPIPDTEWMAFHGDKPQLLFVASPDDLDTLALMFTDAAAAARKNNSPRGAVLIQSARPTSMGALLAREEAEAAGKERVP